MINIIEEQAKAQKNNKAYALATIVETMGTTPRSVGSKMMVFEDGSILGSVGGGVLEQQVLEDAIVILKKNLKQIKEYENKAVNGISPCGGKIKVFIESNRNNHVNLVVCGAGHVGAAVINMASLLNYHITALDTRDTDTTMENVKNADRFELIDEFYQGIKETAISEGSYYIISTYGHEEDCEALAAVLEKNAAYIGMLGSKMKINSIFKKLRDRGFTGEQLEFIHTPVGLNIGGETPQEIALSILAEMQAVRYKKDIN